MSQLSYCRPTNFHPPLTQEAKLRAAWDDQGGAPGATAAIAAELGWRKGAVGRHLKALGLKRGVLTAVQVSSRSPWAHACI